MQPPHRTDIAGCHTYKSKREVLAPAVFVTVNAAAQLLCCGACAAQLMLGILHEPITIDPTERVTAIQQQPWRCGSWSRARMRAARQTAPKLALPMRPLRWRTSCWARATTRRRSGCTRCDACATARQICAQMHELNLPSSVAPFRLLAMPFDATLRNCSCYACEQLTQSNLPSVAPSAQAPVHAPTVADAVSALNGDGAVFCMSDVSVSCGQAFHSSSNN